MEIIKNTDGAVMTVSVVGRLDTITAPELSESISDLAGIEKLILDLEKLEYVSSAGLRVILSAQKAMNSQGSLVIKNVCEDVMEVFEMTGFSEILTIE